jgi:hypothetical protein
MKKSWSQDRRKASRLEQEKAAQDAQAEAAFESLQSWTSPRLGTNTVTTAPFQYEARPDEYMKRKLVEFQDPEQDDFMEDDEEEPSFHTPGGSSRTKYSTPRVLHRADTPVMSNSSRKTTPATASPPVNVTSPFVPRVFSPDYSSTRRATAETPLSHKFVQECRLYHDSLRRFRQAKRRVLDQLEHGGDVDEARVDQDLLLSLQHACYARADTPQKDPLSVDYMEDLARKEGNFWAFLWQLRQIGLNALLYAGTDMRDSVRHFLTSQALRIDATPRELVDSLVGPNAPLSVQRWNALVVWLQSCHDALLPPNIASPRPGGGSGVGLVDGCLLSTDRESEVSRAALNLILAGRLDEAIEMASQSGLEYLGAQWSGGIVAGKEGNKSVGNPRRALWQVLMWKKAQMPENLSSKEALTIAALLSNNTTVSSDSPLLRTWERMLFAFAKAVLGRFEDELLHQHNENRRKARPSFPGTELEEYERQHLNATILVHDMEESTILQEIQAGPFPEIIAYDSFSSAIEAFWQGEQYVVSYMDNWFSLREQNDEVYLRFLVHLALYLDSLQMGSSRRFLPGAAEWKDNLINSYLDYLSSREELWHLMVLYASYLPRDELQNRLPGLIGPIESLPARKEVLSQMNEFLEDGLDRRIILKVSEQTLAEVDMSEDSSVSDARKLNCILWFSLREDLYRDGLVYANKLLRQLVLEDRIDRATTFLKEILPADIARFFEKYADADDEASHPVSGDGTSVPVATGDQCRDIHLTYICREHSALLAYLQAEQIYAEWANVLGGAQAEMVEIDDLVDNSKWTEAEASIAAHERRRKLAEGKREESHKLAMAASSALEHLEVVLKFEGGFLLEDEHGNEENGRNSELEELRSKIIPAVVDRHQEVCMETAKWMSRSLYNGVKRLGKDASGVIRDLDRVSDPNRSVFAPSFWSQRALTIMDSLTSEAYDCLPVLSPESRRKIMSTMADNTIAHLKYRSEVP